MHPAPEHPVGYLATASFRFFMIDVETEFGVRETGNNRWVGNKPLEKPASASRGAYGGNIVGQALLVAIRSAPSGFTPHSLHSLFTKAVLDTTPMEWEVDEIHNGKSFCSRTVKGIQEGMIKYVANVLLTKRNSYTKAKTLYDEWERRHNADDEDDDPPSLRPFRFFVPYPEWLEKHKPETLELADFGCNLAYTKVPPEFLSLDLTRGEESVGPSERRQAFYAQFGRDGEIKITDPAFQYVGLGVILDSVFLTRLARVLRVPSLDHEQRIQYMSLSLDHVIYFHDEEFDTTKWMGFGFRASRIANGRVLLEGEIYNHDGRQVATVIQEGMVHFNGFEEEAKL